MATRSQRVAQRRPAWEPERRTRRPDRRGVASNRSAGTLRCQSGPAVVQGDRRHVGISGRSTRVATRILLAVGRTVQLDVRMVAVICEIAQSDARVVVVTEPTVWS